MAPYSFIIPQEIALMVLPIEPISLRNQSIVFQGYQVDVRVHLAGNLLDVISISNIGKHPSSGRAI